MEKVKNECMKKLIKNLKSKSLVNEIKTTIMYHMINEICDAGKKICYDYNNFSEFAELFEENVDVDKFYFNDLRKKYQARSRKLLKNKKLTDVSKNFMSDSEYEKLVLDNDFLFICNCGEMPSNKEISNSQKLNDGLYTILNDGSCTFEDYFNILELVINQLGNNISYQNMESLRLIIDFQGDFLNMVKKCKNNTVKTDYKKDEICLNLKNCISLLEEYQEYEQNMEILKKMVSKFEYFVNSLKECLVNNKKLSSTPLDKIFNYINKHLKPSQKEAMVDLVKDDDNALNFQNCCINLEPEVVKNEYIKEIVDDIIFAEKDRINKTMPKNCNFFAESNEILKRKEIAGMLEELYNQVEECNEYKEFRNLSLVPFNEPSEDSEDSEDLINIDLFD